MHILAEIQLSKCLLKTLKPSEDNNFLLDTILTPDV